MVFEFSWQIGAGENSQIPVKSSTIHSPSNDTIFVSGNDEPRFLNCDMVWHLARPMIWALDQESRVSFFVKRCLTENFARTPCSSATSSPPLAQSHQLGHLVCKGIINFNSAVAAVAPPHLFNLQGWAQKWFPGLVKFVLAVSQHFCLNLPEKLSQPEVHLLSQPCTRTVAVALEFTKRDWRLLLEGFCRKTNTMKKIGRKNLGGL